MMKYLLTPWVSFFIMLPWAALIGEQVSYFTPGKNMLDEYLIICQLWLMACLIKSLANKIRPKTEDKSI